MKKLIPFLLAVLLLACSHGAPDDFVMVKDGRFRIGDKPYYFIGTNYWYGAILASEGQGGNRERLLKDLDLMQQIGVNNLRVLVGADGLAGQEVKTRPTLQLEPGVYNDTIFDGLDFLMAELGKRKMHAVLFLNNSWEWSGGYGQYLEWAGRGTVPEAGVRDWQAFSAHVAQYADCDSCHAMFLRHVRHVISRTNRYTGKKYAADPSVMAWQVGNEPRAFSAESKPAFAEWLKEATALIRSLAPRQLVSIGSEGSMGSEGDMNLFETTHADPNVDYLTIHIWPKNWKWMDTTKVTESLDASIAKTNEYINAHLAVAQRLNKPLVIEEFGYPRDHHQYTLTDPVTARDKYYENIFAQVEQSAHENGLLSGCNFWAWGGTGRPAHKFWLPGDDYLGDPPQEEQGLNSVFDTDETMAVIKLAASELTN